MKTRTIILSLMAAFALASCAAPSDPTFMQNSAAAINGGMISGPMGAQFSPGLQNRNRPHPFFGAP